MADFKFLKHRRATEQETREFYAEKERVFQMANARDLKGRERFSFIYEQSRDYPFYYSRQLNCVMYAPPDEEVFKHWCRHNDIAPRDMDVARKVWDAAIKFYRESNYDEETSAEVKRGTELLRHMTPEQIRQRSLEHQRQYSQ